MRVIDADGHVNEHPATFDDRYLDPGFRSRRPVIVTSEERSCWKIDDQVFPRRAGTGCNNLSTPARVNGKPTRLGAFIEGELLDSLDSQELTDVKARIEALDAENIDVQVIYPTLFLAYPLASDPALATALCSSYNRWMGDTLSGNERLKWAGVVNLDDAAGAARVVQEARSLGASGIMVLGTAGDRMLDDPALLPFYEPMAEADLTLGVHVGWSWPSFNNLYSDLYPSWITAFLMPLMMGFVAFMTGGLLDRFPNLRVVFLEGGCLWLPFVLDRLNHRFPYARTMARPLSGNQGQRRGRARCVRPQRQPVLERRGRGQPAAPGPGPGGGGPDRLRLRHAPLGSGALRRQNAAGSGRRERIGEERDPGEQPRAVVRVLAGEILQCRSIRISSSTAIAGRRSSCTARCSAASTRFCRPSATGRRT